MANRFLGFIVSMLFTALVFADNIALNPDHPDRYTVVKGDTLWDISETFLRDPWLWPEVWYVNPQIENPHLIYPGDVITLVYVDGKPQLRMQRGGDQKMSPHARSESLEKAIPTIPVDAIKQFLTRPLVVNQDELAAAPYIVDSADEHLVTGANDRVYVRGIDTKEHGRYYVYQPAGEIRDPDTNDVLGYEALYIGDATLQRFGDPSTLLLTSTTQEARIGDRMMPIVDEDVQTQFHPRPPENQVEGRILSVLGGVTQIGQYQVVSINLGTQDGMEPGNVLRIWQTGHVIQDPVSRRRNDKVQLPEEEAGLMLVFRTFDRVSYGLVMKASRPLHVLDIVRNP